MADSTLWWLLAGAAVAVELLTGTFYLLMLALGLAAGALAAHARRWPRQRSSCAAALVGGGAVGGWHWRRGARRPGAGARPTATSTSTSASRSTSTPGPPTARRRCSYRGAAWTAVPRRAARRRARGTAPRARSATGSRARSLEQDLNQEKNTWKSHRHPVRHRGHLRRRAPLKVVPQQNAWVVERLGKYHAHARRRA